MIKNQVFYFYIKYIVLLSFFLFRFFDKMYNGIICFLDIIINYLLVCYVSLNYEKIVRVYVFWELFRDVDY